MIHKSIYSFQSLFVQRNKEKVVKAFFFQTIDVRLWSSQGFPENLIEYNMRNIFLEKSYKESDEETTPRPFPKKQNWVYLWINSLKFYSLFIIYQHEDYWNIMKLSCWPLVRNSYKAFKKNKNKSEKSLSASFSTTFLKKNISLVIFYYLTKFHCLVAFNWRDIGQYRVSHPDPKW